MKDGKSIQIERRGFGGCDKVVFLYTTKKVVLGCLTISVKQNKMGTLYEYPKRKEKFDMKKVIKTLV